MLGSKLLKEMEVFYVGHQIVHCIFTSPPEGVARYCFETVRLCVCMSVCPTNILVFISWLLEEILI